MCAATIRRASKGKVVKREVNRSGIYELASPTSRLEVTQDWALHAGSACNHDNPGERAFGRPLKFLL
jgi:hypothetical protein